MACAAPEEVNERLTCAIRMEQFKEPKVLPCLHTYCKQCLVKLVKKQGSDHVITCPECRQDTKVPGGDVGKLQSNFWVNNFMTLLSMQDSTSSAGKPLICEHCDSGDPAVSRCSDCSVFMCDFCVAAHKRIIATKGHQILSLTEVKTLGSKALIKPVYCVKHTSEMLKLFCDTCQETICRDCTIVDHREHKYNFVADVAEKERQSVQACLKRTKAIEHAVVKGLKAVQVMKMSVQSKVSEVKKEVDTFFDEQVKALEYYRANLKHEVMAEGQVRVIQLENQKEVLSSFLSQLKSGIDFTDQAITGGDDVKLLSIKKQLIQRLAQLNSSQTQCNPCTDDYLKLHVHQTIWDIDKMVTLCYIPFDPQKCTVSMVGGEEGVMYQTLVGQEVELLLTIKDENGQKKTEGGHQVGVQVTLFCEETHDHAIQKIPVRDNGDGSYSFSYCPEAEEHVTLSVTVEGQEVGGNPFHLKVNSELPDRNLQGRQKKPAKKSRKIPLRGLQTGKNASAFQEGMHCWKLQLTSFDAEKRCQLEIGITTSHMFYPYGFSIEGHHRAKWSWNYNAENQRSFLLPDRQESSLTSVEDNDVFTVFLNLETKKFIIYNVRSKQTAIFTGVEGDGLVPIISCQNSTNYYHYGDCPRLDVQ